MASQKASVVQCPVPGCPTQKAERKKIIQHMRHGHGIELDTTKGGNLSHQRTVVHANQFAAWLRANGLKEDISFFTHVDDGLATPETRRKARHASTFDPDDQTDNRTDSSDSSGLREQEDDDFATQEAADQARVFDEDFPVMPDNTGDSVYPAERLLRAVRVVGSGGHIQIFPPVEQPTLSVRERAESTRRVNELRRNLRDVPSDFRLTADIARCICDEGNPEIARFALFCERFAEVEYDGRDMAAFIRDVARMYTSWFCNNGRISFLKKLEDELVDARRDGSIVPLRRGGSQGSLHRPALKSSDKPCLAQIPALSLGSTA
ncbi:hypothetical protein BAUCODRAFT_391544 [Baudoinia panamericana UAMH 10762]|uniref:Uncharacterized protein n=1 Tax=Baudoinia panamericana (strain UAMH 10762) TaxID=717646 RepID=M2NJ18_BAUPA|nr:uncharacterized protein BAUCODRAFT_391544 [Baudoinia panamericana UAMH 10762]EMC99100.1 hypothetical protein BAUCODRAFT_391544 [Baudoinia panamericana UAMH 10762]